MNVKRTRSRLRKASWMVRRSNMQGWHCVGICLGLLWLDPTVYGQESSLLHASRRPIVGGPTVPSGPTVPAAAIAPVAATLQPLPGSQYQAVPLASPGGSYLGPPPGGDLVSDGATLQSTSWTYRPEPMMRTFSKHDIVTVRVDEIARMLAEGDAQSRKNTLFRGILTDWISLSKGRLRPDAQPEGDPSVGTLSNDIFRSQSMIESRESLAFNIAATIVDIRPNGNLVLEARKSYRVNDNLWETSLTGICRVQDIGPDNIVLSRDVIDLQIGKEDQGHLRDKYRRGWFTRWLDRLQPF